MNTPAPALSEWTLSAPDAPHFESALGASSQEPFSGEPLLAVPDLLPARVNGFTLARLLLVIALTGALSALAAPTFFPTLP